MARGIGKIQKTIKALISKQFAAELRAAAPEPHKWHDSHIFWGLFGTCLAFALLAVGILVPTVGIALFSLVAAWVFWVLALVVAFRDFNNRSARIVVTLLLAGLAGVVLIQVARYRESPTDLAGPLSHIEAMVKEIRDFLLLPHGTNPAPNGASAPGKPARLIASLDYVAGGCVNSDSVITSDLARTVLLYVVTLRAEDGDVKIDESSIACSAKTTSGPNKNQEEYFAGKSTTDLYGVAFYEMGGAESINAVDWLAEAAFAGPIRAGDGIRKRVACEMGQDSPGQRVGNPMKVFYSYYKPIYEVSFKDATGKSYALTGQWAEPPMPLRKRSVLRPNLDRRFLGLPMDNLPPRLSDVKPAMLINFAGRVSPDGKPVPDSIPWDDPTSKSNYFGFEQCSHH